MNVYTLVVSLVKLKYLFKLMRKLSMGLSKIGMSLLFNLLNV